MEDLIKQISQHSHYTNKPPAVDIYIDRDYAIARLNVLRIIDVKYKEEEPEKVYVMTSVPF